MECGEKEYAQFCFGSKHSVYATCGPIVRMDEKKINPDSSRNVEAIAKIVPKELVKTGSQRQQGHQVCAVDPTDTTVKLREGKSEK